MHSRQSCPDVWDFSPAHLARAAPRIRAWRRSEPGVRRDAWWYPLMELIAHGGPMDRQLRTDLRGYALAVQLGDTLKVDGRP